MTKPTSDSRGANLSSNAWIFVRVVVFLSELAAWVLALAMTLLGKWWWAAASGMFALGADAVGRAWSRKSPVPLPSYMWWFLLLPRGPHSPKNLRRILEPQRGERILEIGPGVGVHAQEIAAALRPDGVLDVLDVQQAMLDRLMRRATKAGLTNIVPRQGDARELPYPAATFDAVYLIGVLGEVPDAGAALREIRRVLKPTGRLVIGELLIDPDHISLPALRERGNETGLAFVRQAGPSFAYWAVFRPRGGERPDKSAPTERGHLARTEVPIMMRSMWVVLGLLLLMSQVTAAGTTAYTRTSSSGGVDVQAVYATSAYFKTAGDTGGRHRFKPEQQVVFLLTFDTHAGDLSRFAVVRNSRLRTSAGKTYAPLRWVPTSESSHHRSGALIFPTVVGGARVIGPAVTSITLVLRGLGGVPEHVLRWRLPIR